jgi:hypothetical protein
MPDLRKVGLFPYSEISFLKKLSTAMREKGLEDFYSYMSFTFFSQTLNLFTSKTRLTPLQANANNRGNQ